MGKEGKLKASTSTATVESIAKPEHPTTPKSSHRGESFKRKLEADNIVVTTRSRSVHFTCFISSVLVPDITFFSFVHAVIVAHLCTEFIAIYSFSLLPPFIETGI